MEFDFKEAIDNVKDTAKKIPKWGWAALAGGAIIIYMGSRRTQYAEPGIVSAEKLTGATSQSIGGGDSQSMSAGTDGVLSQLTEAIGELETQNTDLSSAFNRISNEFVSYQANTNTVLEQTNTTFKSYEDRLAYSELESNLPNIYFDGRNDLDQYTSLASTIQASNIKAEEKSALVQKVAGLGNNGVADPNGGKSYTAAEIKADPERLKSAIELTNAVIANRKEAGLDISKQESWLKQLQ